MSSIKPESFLYWKKYALATEAALAPAWLWFSLTYSRRTAISLISLPQRLLLACSPFPVACALFLPVSTFFYSPDFAAEGLLFLNNAGFFFYLFLMVCLTAALINLEMTLMNASLSARFKIKFDILGGGAIIAVMIFYYSQGLLFRTIDMNISPVRSVILIVSAAMMAYSWLKRGNGVKVHVSRHMAYKSFVIIMVGMYLIGLGVMGEGFKYYGDGFRRALIISVAFLSGLALILILLSETAKRKIRVFIHKNFYQNKYDYRTQWLQFTDRLSSSTSSDNLLRSIVTGFCDTFGMGCGALFLLDSERTTYQLAIGIGLDDVPVDFPAADAGLEWISEHSWVADLRQWPQKIGGKKQERFFSDNQACFVIPLLIKQKMDGFIVLGKAINRNESYVYEDFDLMKTLARQASSTLLNLRLSDQLARSREMAAIGKVSTFVVHDLKNLVSTVSLVLENAREYITVPEFQEELLRSLTATVTKMNDLILRLKYLPKKESQERTPVDLLQLVHDTAALFKGGELKVTGTPAVAEGNLRELQKVALNLMLNAVEASEGKQPVTVEVGNEGSPFIRVKDMGCGIPQDFLRKKLFTPFTTTKNHGLGIGLYQCKQIVEAHGGKIEVTSEPNKGSEFTVRFQKAASCPLPTGL